MNHAIRHQSTDAEIEDLIKLINCHLPAPVFLRNLPILSKFKTTTIVQHALYHYILEVQKGLIIRIVKL